MSDERTMSERLRRAWDQLSREDAEVEITQTSLMDAVHQLRALDAADGELSPDPTFVGTLEERLMRNSAPRYAIRSAVADGSFSSVSPRQSRRGLALHWMRGDQRSRAISSLAAVAIMLLTLATGFAAYQLAPREGKSPVADKPIPAERGQVPGPDDCRTEPRDLAATRLDGTPTTPSLIPPERQYSDRVTMLTTDELPSGPAGDRDAIAGITSTLRVLTACENARDYEAVEALFSDDYIRRFDLADSSRALGVEPDVTSVSLPEHLWEPIPIVEETRLLADGRLGGLVVSVTGDTRGAATHPNFIIFARTGDRWLIDDFALVGDQLRATVNMLDIGYEPNTITVPEGIPVTISLENFGQNTHTFNITKLRIRTVVAEGQLDEVTINAPVGDYEFFCEIPGHREAGMVGRLNVTERDERAGTPWKDR